MSQFHIMYIVILDSNDNKITDNNVLKSISSSFNLDSLEQEPTIVNNEILIRSNWNSQDEIMIDISKFYPNYLFLTLEVVENYPSPDLFSNFIKNGIKLDWSKSKERYSTKDMFFYYSR